ncbi:MAG: PEGA domain-containing protein [Rectinemataceae bacterium]
MKRKFIAMTLFLLIAGTALFAQAKTSINVQSNQVGARVYLNDNLAGYTNPNFSALVVPGLYTVRVTKDGYPEFRTTVSVGSSPINLVANFGNSTPPTIPPPQVITKYPLSINTDRQGAEVYIDGKYYGRAPLNLSLQAGSYRIAIRLQGYSDFEQRIQLNGHYALYATMQPLVYGVYIEVPNIQGALVYRDSTLLGTAPYGGAWPQGEYLLRVVAPGYADYLESVRLFSPWNARISMTPLYVDYEIRVPDGFFPRDYKESKGKSWKDYELFFDGQRVESPFGKAAAGIHQLSLYAGVLRLETQIELKPGKSVVIEPFFGAKVY